MNDVLSFFLKNDNVAIAVLGMGNIAWLMLYVTDRRANREDRKAEAAARASDTDKMVAAMDRSTTAFAEVTKTVVNLQLTVAGLK